MDADLLCLWELWKQSFADQVARQGEDVAHRARTCAIERDIFRSPAEGMIGIGIKLGLSMFLNDREGTDARKRVFLSVLDDVKRVTGRDSFGEAQAAARAGRTLASSVDE